MSINLNKKHKSHDKFVDQYCTIQTNDSNLGEMQLINLYN